MPEEEYVYTKPVENKKPKKKLEVLVFLVVLVIAAYFLFFYNRNPSNQNSGLTNKTFTIGNKNYTIISVPAEYKGSEGLGYIRNNSLSELDDAKSLCTDQFKGEWVDNPNVIGCYNMQSFSTYYCNNDALQALINLCNQIKGNPDCSANKVFCSV